MRDKDTCKAGKKRKSYQHKLHNQLWKMAPQDHPGKSQRQTPPTYIICDNFGVLGTSGGECFQVLSTQDDRRVFCPAHQSKHLYWQLLTLVQEYVDA